MVPTFQVPMEVSADKNFQRLSHALCVFYVINYDCNPLKLHFFYIQGNAIIQCYSYRYEILRYELRHAFFRTTMDDLSAGLKSLRSFNSPLQQDALQKISIEKIIMEFN